MFYKVSDPSVYAMCDMVCANIARQYEQTSSDRALSTPSLADEAKLALTDQPINMAGLVIS